MFSRAPLVLLVVALAACGGDSTGIVTPPPPPPVVHAHLVAPSDTVVKASGVIALSALYRVVDDQGSPISGATVSLTSAPSTWTHTSSSFTPALDSRGRVAFSVVAPGADVVSDTASVQITAQLDFKRYTWHATWACSFAPGTHTSPNTTMEVDSMYASLAADTTYVLGDQSPVPLNTFGAVIYGTMTYTFFGDSIETTTQVGALPANIPGSVIDTLYYSVSPDINQVADRDTTAALPRYVGGTQCVDIASTPIAPVVLQAMTDKVN